MGEQEKTKAFPQLLLKETADQKSLDTLERGRGVLPLTSLIEEAVTLSVSWLRKPRPILVVKNSLYNAQRLYERIASIVGEEACALFSADESLRVEAIASSPEMMAGKVETLAALREHPNRIVITGLTGFLRHLPDPAYFDACCIDLEVGGIMEPGDLKRALRASGYYQTAHIDQPLSFAARGGIIDIYSINYNQPVRVEFFDNEIDSIRMFDAETQKTITPVNHVRIVPASDILFEEKETEELRQKLEELCRKEDDALFTANISADLDLIEEHIAEQRLYPYKALLSHTASLTDYMEQPLIVLSDEEEIRQSLKRLQNETVSYIQEMYQEKKLPARFAVWHEFDRLIDRFSTVREDPFADERTGIQQLHVPNERLELRLKMLAKEERVLLCLHEDDLERVLTACINAGIAYSLVQDTIPEQGFNILIQPLSEGFILNDLYVVSPRELLEVHRAEGRYSNKFRSAEIIHSYDELEPGDYIVHEQHGVGQYVGIETREINKTTRDFLKIIYRGNAELLVPLEQFRLVRKFVSREGVVPRLNKLGSDEWEKTRKRLEENVSDIADRLIALYAVREENIGHAYQPDSELQAQFERDFPYELTPDQEAAVADVKRDMESPKPMDRLVCGDVGFGKTEIAVRAAFKAAAENKQVAVLCPTTILAEQHFRTFSDRFADYPFTVRVLDRYDTQENVKQTLKETKEGKVDILIGTHRILSKDVEFKDLGLLVVDEEQRFGVEHKERIKELKNNIDVLTLSATPIPRTLQMSLIGIRSLSSLETPPEGRYSVQTYVVEKNKGLVLDAIEKELARGGQVFYLYNNIERIYNVARDLRNSLPDARVGIIHGKMDREAVENVMMDFNDRKINILVCTTIIENGIDIPNANTIFIDNAQDFGLAQIYQIKGRVGRSNRVAYAYLLVPPRKQLSETAQKRLQAVKEFARLGSGYRIAMRDLTIRGAGDLLGADQSGFIDTVGIDMYVEMLERAIEKKKGIERPQTVSVHAKTAENGYIPKKFAPDDYDKISMYQKIDAIADEAELNEYRARVIDEYGRLPQEVSQLFSKKQLDLRLNSPEVEDYKEIKGKAEVTFSEPFTASLDGVKLFELYTKLSKDITLRYRNNRITASIPMGKGSLNNVLKMIETAKEAVR
ncbi:MAG: transcription-repair coupling factor [Solobacterium sp.]|nr:transcription-repair coupling factor [Solobacterium sp.]